MTNHSRDNFVHLKKGDILADAGVVASRAELRKHTVHLSNFLRLPTNSSFWPESLHIFTENIRIAVEDPSTNPNDGPAGDTLAADRVPLIGDHALREPACGWMEAECFFDARAEKRKPLGFGEGDTGIGYGLGGVAENAASISSVNLR
jgi:hypothetical protein